jgi:hypothetical protein
MILTIFFRGMLIFVVVRVSGEASESTVKTRADSESNE